MVKALIVIDMFTKDIRGRYDEKKLISNQIKLIKKFKEKKLPVIFTGPKFGSKPNPVYEKLWGDEYGDSKKSKKESSKIRHENLAIIPELLEIGYDKLIEKENYSAFFNTSLERYCKKHKITELYLAGISGGCCVHYTGIDAMYRRIQPVLITDATSSPSAKRHKHNIKEFNIFIGPSMTTNKVIKSLN